MTESPIESSRWLSLPEVADALDSRLRDVRDLVAERRLVAVRRGANRVWSVPEEFLASGEPGEPGYVVLSSLRGTVMQLGDSGFDDEEIVVWLFAPNEELDERPIDALRRGRTHAVRRAAQHLAF
ncbi:Rv2175c family DNA-binding protein [Ruania halotolerans]|uniref:Rv2175c family DNA-binding protein n=1 Tax=Ruania halotolerans TaxID=2897773 RepID=UPI001E3682DF|nr:Rv2175c family DNA-binding protein [Ruania halotolerans]UFU04820.1 DNA-binding protein [Ruania halotolerans]